MRLLWPKRRKTSPHLLPAGCGYPPATRRGEVVVAAGATTKTHLTYCPTAAAIRQPLDEVRFFAAERQKETHLTYCPRTAAIRQPLAEVRFVAAEATSKPHLAYCPPAAAICQPIDEVRFVLLRHPKGGPSGPSPRPAGSGTTLSTPPMAVRGFAGPGARLRPSWPSGPGGPESGPRRRLGWPRSTPPMAI